MGIGFPSGPMTTGPPPLPPLSPPDVTERLPLQPVEMVFVSMVTAPFAARALPQPIVAPVFRVMLVSARIFPTKSVPVPRVAELPTCQYTLQLSAPLITLTDELLGVVIVLPIWKMNSALGLP